MVNSYCVCVRACGQIYCSACCNHKVTIPSIARVPVRVCDLCASSSVNLSSEPWIDMNGTDWDIDPNDLDSPENKDDHYYLTH